MEGKILLDELVLNGYFSKDDYDFSKSKLDALFNDGDVFAYPISQLGIYTGHTDEREIIRAIRIMNGENQEHDLVMPGASGKKENPQVHTEFSKNAVATEHWLKEEFKGLYTLIEVKKENGEIHFVDKITNEEIFLPFNRQNTDDIEQRRKKAVDGEEIFFYPTAMVKIDDKFNEYLSMYDRDDYFKKAQDYLDFFEEVKRKPYYEELRTILKKQGEEIEKSGRTI